MIVACLSLLMAASGEALVMYCVDTSVRSAGQGKLRAPTVGRQSWGFRHVKTLLCVPRRYVSVC